jgi:DNA-binding CsgD family transcriptional regulator
MFEGDVPKEIAFKLNISHSTVNFHRGNLYNKLGVKNIQELFTKYGAAFFSGAFKKNSQKAKG